MSSFNLPPSTKLRQKLKTSFEKRVKSRKIFEDIDAIVLTHKLAPNTINIPQTNNVVEILIFEITLKTKEIPKKTIQEIKKLIPIPILFHFRYEDNFSYGISLEEEDKFYFSSWNEKIEFNFNDTNLEKVYQNLVKKFLKNIDTIPNENLDFKKIIQFDSKINKLSKEIDVLRKKRDKERQFNKKAILNKELKALQKKLEALKDDMR